MAAGESMTIAITVATESFGELTVAEVLNVAVVDANEDELTDDNNRAEETTPISEVRDELPETGYDSGRLALIGLLALGLGGLLLGVTRRRNEGETD